MVNRLRSIGWRNVFALGFAWVACGLLVISSVLHILTLAKDIPHGIMLFYDALTILAFGYFASRQFHVIEVNQLRQLLDDETPVDRESIPAAVRRLVIERDASICSYCYSVGNADKDAEGQSWHCDHVIPISRGGRTHPSNLTLSCSRCNLSKGSKTPVEFLRYRYPQHRR